MTDDNSEVALGISPRLPLDLEMFIKEVADKVSVASNISSSEGGLHRAIVLQQCRNFLVDRYAEALEALRDAQQRFQQAVGCPHDGDCACAVTSRHEAFEWFCLGKEALRDAQQQRTELEDTVNKLDTDCQRLYTEKYACDTTIRRLERKIAAGPKRKWIETDDPEVIACMGAGPECAANGCQYRIVSGRLANAKADLSRLTEARDTLQSRVDDLEGRIGYNWPE